MNKIRFKTRIFETIYFIVFGLFITTITCLLAFKVYKESLTAFIICLFCSLFILVFFIILSLVFYQYCEFIDNTFVFRCPLYIIKKIKINEIVKYDRCSIYEKSTRTSIIYPVIRIYISEPKYKIKYKYLVNKKSQYFHIYDVNNNYDTFLKIINNKILNKENS